MRAHRKKQRVHETAADEEAQVSEGAGTALATQSTGAAPLFGRMVGSNNAKLFLGCVKNALEDPLPFSRFTDYPDMGVKQQRDMLFHCKQRVPSRYFVSLSIYSPLFFLHLPLVVQLAYEELVLGHKTWDELQKAGRQILSLEDACHNIQKAKEKAEAELAAAVGDAGRRVQEAEEKAKAAVASEAIRMEAEFDKRLEIALGKAKEDAVLAYRRDRGRAVEQATAYMDGGKYILGKIKEAFPEQDWSQLPVPEVTEDFVDDEHRGILQEIEEELTGASARQPQPEE